MHQPPNQTVTPGKQTEDAEAAIYAEIERIQKEPVADWELTKAVNGARSKVSFHCVLMKSMVSVKSSEPT